MSATGTTFVSSSAVIAEPARPWGGGTTQLTPYVGPSHFAQTDDVAAEAQGYLVDFRPAPGGEIRPHAHPIQQFQVVVGGGGRLGRRAVAKGSFHYVDPFTTYGPIVPGRDGIQYFTLRPRGTGTAYWMPEDRERVRGQRGRNLFGSADIAPVGLTSLLEPADDGLAAFAIRLRPRERRFCPPANRGGGQFIIVLEGRLREGGRDLPERSLVHVSPTDDAPELESCTEEALAILVQFPAAD